MSEGCQTETWALRVERRVFEILRQPARHLTKRERELLPHMQWVLNDLLTANPSAISFEIRVFEEPQPCAWCARESCDDDGCRRALEAEARLSPAEFLRWLEV